MSTRTARTLWVLGLVFCATVAWASVAWTQASSNNWTEASPASLGMNSELLDLMVSVIDESAPSVDGLVVVRHGQIALEHYPAPSEYDESDMRILYSVTKSVTSILVGIAIDQGFIGGVDDLVVDYFTDLEIAYLDDRKARMTLEDLLTMTSGLAWEGPDDMHHSWGQAVLSRNPVQYTLNQPMSHEPGEHFLYNGGCSHLLSAIISKATGMSTRNFARDYLFWPLGIQSFYWPVDPTGVYYGGQDIRLSPRDLAKLGQLYLDDGLWNGERIVSEAWVNRSSQPLVNQSTTDYGYGYGYQWWVLPEGTIYQAWGALDQHLFVVPDLDLVVAVTSDNQVPNQAQGELREGILLGDWLLSRFVIPACDEYEPVPFSDHSVQVRFPRATALRVRDLNSSGDATLGSGLVKAYHPYSPFDMARVQWYESSSNESQTALADYVQYLLQAWGSMAESTGSLGTAEVRGHTASLTGYRVEIPGLAVHEGVIAAWFCDETERQFVATYGEEGLQAPSTLLDPTEGLSDFLGTLDCHP